MSSAPTFRIKRNGVVLTTWTPPYSASSDASYIPAGTTMRLILDTPGGAASYTVEALVASGLQVYHRSVLVQSVMR